MAGQKGYKGKTALGQNALTLIGKWTPSGMQAAVLDGTKLGDTYTVKAPGRIDPGNVTVEGFYDPDDSTGQDLLRAALAAGTAVDTLRFYYGSGETDFYYAASDTKLYVTGLTGPVVDKDDSGLCPVTYTIEISDGPLYKADAILEADTISFSDSDPDTIGDSDDGLVTAGFKVAMNVTIENSTSNDGRSFTIDSGGLASNQLTLVSGDTLTAEIAGDDVALIGTTL